MSDATASYNAPTVPPDDDRPMGTPSSGSAEFADAAKYLGRVVGGVKLDRLLGAGGMGAVFAGEHERLGKQVAIKILPKGLAREGERAERFLREARAAAKLEHPNIVTVFDVGEEADVWFISMRFVEGESAAGRVRRTGPLPVGEVLRITRGVAAALEAAHKRNIVHRDVKPENVLLGTEDEVLLADFGLVRDLDAGTQLSQSGQILGTPAYMSPEQARGEPVDHRSDLYSLGTTAYFLATGLPPFQAETAIATALKHIMDDPVPPSQEADGIPRAFDAFIDLLMAKRPDSRPASATAVIEEIDRLLGGGLATDPPGPRSKAGLGLLAGAGIGVVLLALIGAAMSGRTNPGTAGAPGHGRTTSGNRATPSTTTTPPAPAATPDPIADPAATAKQLESLLANERFDEAIALAGRVIRAPQAPEALLTTAERIHIAATQRREEAPLKNALYARVTSFRRAVLRRTPGDVLDAFVAPGADPLSAELMQALLRLTPTGIAWGGEPTIGPLTADATGRRVAAVLLPFQRRARPDAGITPWQVPFVLERGQWYPSLAEIQHTVKPAMLLLLDQLFTANPRDRKRLLEAETDASLQARDIEPGTVEYKRHHALMTRGLGLFLAFMDRAEVFEYRVDRVEFDSASRVAQAAVHVTARMPNQAAKETDAAYEFKLVSGRWLWWSIDGPEREDGRNPGWTGRKPGDTRKRGEGKRPAKGNGREK